MYACMSKRKESRTSEKGERKRGGMKEKKTIKQKEWEKEREGERKCAYLNASILMKFKPFPVLVQRTDFKMNGHL